jgi:putative tricarboxylic transport membrane protein
MHDKLPRAEEPMPSGQQPEGRPSGQQPEGRLVSKRTMDIAVALVFLGVSALVLYDSRRLGVRWQEGVGPAAGYFPFYVALIMAGASLINLVQAIREKGAAGETFVSGPAFRQVLAVFLPLTAFVIAIAFIGIYVAAAIFIALFMMYVGRYNIVPSAAVGAGVPVALFLMFEKWFLVPLPKGPLETLLGY